MGSVKQWMRSLFGVMIIAGLAIRLILAPLFTFNSDINWWSLVITTEQDGMGLYDTLSYFYTPPWGYVLAFVSLLCPLLGVTDYGTFVQDLVPFIGSEMTVNALVPSMAYSVVIKIPLILADLAVAYLIYKVVSERYGEGKATLASALWFLCPLTILESSVHVMFDNLAVLGTLMAFILLSRCRYFLAGAAFSLAVLIKFFPVFLIFILVAILFRKEGFTARGAKALIDAVAGALAAFILTFLPSILTGDFWEAMRFIVSRVGASPEMMESIFTPTVTIALLAAVVLLIAVAWYVVKRTDIVSRILTMAPTESFHMRLRKALVLVALLAAVAVVVTTLFGSFEGSFSEVFEALGMRVVTILLICSILLNIYLAYRLLFIDDKDDRQAATLIMLSAFAIFLWPPAPQYVVLLIPFVAVFATVYMPALIRPTIVLGVSFTLYQLILGNVSVLYTLSVYAGFPSMGSLIPVLEFLTSYVGPIPMIGIFMVVFGGAAYISMLYVPYRWYRCAEVKDEES